MIKIAKILFNFYFFISFIFALPIKNFDRTLFFEDDDEFDDDFTNQIYQSETINSFNNGSNVTMKSYNDLEYGELFEGDIILPDDQVDFLQSRILDEEAGNTATRTGLLSRYYRWPKNFNGIAVIPYFIDSRSGYCELL